MHDRRVNYVPAGLARRVEDLKGANRRGGFAGAPFLPGTPGKETIRVIEIKLDQERLDGGTGAAAPILVDLPGDLLWVGFTSHYQVYVRCQFDGAGDWVPLMRDQKIRKKYRQLRIINPPNPPHQLWLCCASENPDSPMDMT